PARFISSDVILRPGSEAVTLRSWRGLDAPRRVDLYQTRLLRPTEKNTQPVRKKTRLGWGGGGAVPAGPRRRRCNTCERLCASGFENVNENVFALPARC